MKSDMIEVSGREDCTQDVLRLAEKTAVYQQLSPQGALQLRLLAEETTCLMRAVAGDVSGRFWIESSKDEYELHLKVRTYMDSTAREKLLSAATSGENEAERGFLGKLRAFFTPAEGAPILYDLNPDGTYADMSWSMRAYQQQVQQYLLQNSPGAAEAWDELEKSVLAHAADDVKVSIRGSDVEMTVLKKLA